MPSCFTSEVWTENRTAQQLVAGIAARQHGNVTRAQLLAAGIASTWIARRLEVGVLIAVHRGVYRVGHAAPSIEAMLMAAVLACGPGALLCLAAAAYLERLQKRPPRVPVVLTPTERRVPGVKTVRCRSIDPRDRTVIRGIPATTVPRTLVDLAGELDAGALARACHEAGVLHRTTPRHVVAVLARRPNAPGAAKLRAVIGGETKVLLSRLERRFLELLDAEGLPLPITNKPAGGRRVDCRWPEYRVTVELDSYTYHSSRHAWEQDRRREREAYARGDAFRRFTSEDVFDRPGVTMGEMRGLLT